MRMRMVGVSGEGKKVEEDKVGEPQALGSGGWGEGTIKVKTQARTKVLI